MWFSKHTSPPLPASKFLSSSTFSRKIAPPLFLSNILPLFYQPEDQFNSFASQFNYTQSVTQLSAVMLGNNTNTFHTSPLNKLS